MELSWHEVMVGDICRLRHKDNIPADCLLLWSSGEGGVVYVETSSLDGETNLKRKQALAETLEHLDESEASVAQWKGCVKAEYPHRFISSFTGNVSISVRAVFVFVVLLCLIVLSATGRGGRLQTL